MLCYVQLVYALEAGPQDVLVIDNEYLQFKDQKLALPVKTAELYKFLGEPSRQVYNAAGTVVIWDELGISCYGCSQEYDTETANRLLQLENETDKLEAIKEDLLYVDSLSMIVRKYNPYPDLENSYVHEPQNPFPGVLELDGVIIDGTTTFPEFVKKRVSDSQIILPDNSFSVFIRCKPKPHEITIHTIRDKYHDDFLSIYNVTIRNVGAFYRNIPCREKIKKLEVNDKNEKFDENDAKNEGNK